jgi:hypothetical protein
MALPIAPAGTATAFSDGEFTVVAGSPVGLFITNAVDGGIPAGIDFELAFKTAGDDYTVYVTLNSANIAQYSSLSVPGTYAVRRLAAYYSGASAGFEVTGLA